MDGGAEETGGGDDPGTGIAGHEQLRHRGAGLIGDAGPFAPAGLAQGADAGFEVGAAEQDGQGGGRDQAMGTRENRPAYCFKPPPVADSLAYRQSMSSRRKDVSSAAFISDCARLGW